MPDLWNAHVWDAMFHLPSAMPVLEKVFRPMLIYVFLVILLRIFGKRELAQLNPFDLVVLLLLSNTVQINAGAIAPTLPHVQPGGALKCLAITAETRWPDMPDVPTMAESGFPDFNFAVDCVMLAPAKTPPEIVKWLEQETLKVLSTAEMKDRLYKAGFLVRPKGADAAYARVTKEVESFRDLIEKAGIKKL